MSDKKVEPAKVEAKTVEKTPADAVVKKSPKVSMPKISQKTLMVGGIVVGVLALFSGLVYWGANSNSKIPVFSAVANSIERATLNNSSSVRKDAVEDIFKPYMDELEEYAGEEITSEQLQAIFINDGETKERDSVKSRGKMTLSIGEEITGDGDYDMDFDFEIYTLIDVSKNRPVFELDATFSTVMEMMDEEVEGSADIKFAKEIFYGKIYDVSGPTELPAEYEEVMDMWFSYDTSEYFDQLEELMELMEEEADEDFSEVLFEQEDLDMINEMLYSDAILDSISYVADREIEGVQTKCMQFDFDEDDLMELIEIAAPYQEDYEDYDEEEMQEMLDETREDMEDELGKGFSLIFEVCTGRGDDLLYFASVEFEMEDVDFYMEYEYFDYGVEEDIDTPNDAESLDDALNEIIPSTEEYDYDDYIYDEDDYGFDEYDYLLDEDDYDWETDYDEIDW